MFRWLEPMARGEIDLRHALGLLPRGTD